MNYSKILLDTLEFKHPKEGGAVLETFFPWSLTLDRWNQEGLPSIYCTQNLYHGATSYSQRYLKEMATDEIYNYEKYLGFDGVKRMSFRIPFRCFDSVICEETSEYIIRQDTDGWKRKYHKTSGLVETVQPVIENEEDWIKLKEKVMEHLELYCTDENIQDAYGRFKEEHEAGKFSIRFRVSGFFWTPRELFGIEEHLYAFYDMPELMKEINQFVVDTYKKYLGKIFDIIKPEVILFEEDLSGCNGPMISPAIFNEFVAAYYKQLFPFLKEKGVKNIFVDTDGDFNQIIPEFIAAGVDGFLPMDVNAGMDIVAVREKYPNLKFIGGFNKLKIAEGKEAIDEEFKRLLPVIKQGGYVPGCDHQAAPSTSFEDYKYYLKRLKEVMERD